MIVPPQDISISHPLGSAKLLQYTHIIENAGDGPLELIPNYNPATNTATAVQNVYALDAAGNWSMGSSVPVSGVFTFHAIHNHYHYPLASYGLYGVNGDGSVGAPLALSSKIGYCIAENTFVEHLAHTTGPHYDQNTCGNPTAVRGIAVGYGDQYDWNDYDQSIDITNLPDGTYWFVSVADPNHYLQQKNQTSHVASLLLKIAGDVVSVQQPPPPPPAPIIDQYTTVDSKTQTATAPPVVVTSPNQLLLAFAASDGPADGPQTIAISGGGLNWTLVRRSNSQGGTSEIWSAVAPNAGASVAATSAMTVPGHQSLAVVTLKGTAAVGATASASASSGAPAATLSTTSAGSWVFAVGNDWDHALPRALGPNQTMVHQWVDDPVNDTFWSQATSAAIPNAGTSVQMNDTAPTTDRWNLAAVEVVTNPAGSSPPVISAVTASAITSNSAIIMWTTDKPATTQVAYGLTLPYGTSTSLDGNLVTTHSQTLTDLMPNALYHYQVKSADTTNALATSSDFTFTTLASTTPPVIGNVAARNLMPSSALVDWTTDRPATSQVDFGTTFAYGSSTTLDSSLVTLHSQYLRGLSANTLYHYRVRSVDSSGSAATSDDHTFTTPSFATISIDRTVFQDGRDTVTTPSFSVTPSEVMLAFVASDGPAGGPQSVTISGGGVTWTLVRRANDQAGTAEVWRASQASQVAMITVTSTQSVGGYDQSLTVVLLAGVAGVGTSAASSAPSGAPSVTLTTTQPGSWVSGVGHDWDSATPRTLGPDQAMLHQWVDTAPADTFWTQSVSAPVQAANATVQLNDVAPTNDRWNFTSVEVLAATT